MVISIGSGTRVGGWQRGVTMTRHDHDTTMNLFTLLVILQLESIFSFLDQITYQSFSRSAAVIHFCVGFFFFFNLFLSPDRSRGAHRLQWRRLQAMAGRGISSRKLLGSLANVSLQTFSESRFVFAHILYSWTTFMSMNNNKQLWCIYWICLMTNI